MRSLPQIHPKPLYIIMVYVGDETTLLGDHRMGVFNIKGWDYNPIVPKKRGVPHQSFFYLGEFYLNRKKGLHNITSYRNMMNLCETLI